MQFFFHWTFFYRFETIEQKCRDFGKPFESTCRCRRCQWLRLHSSTSIGREHKPTKNKRNWKIWDCSENSINESIYKMNIMYNKLTVSARQMHIQNKIKHFQLNWLEIITQESTIAYNFIVIMKLETWQSSISSRDNILCDD